MRRKLLAILLCVCAMGMHVYAQERSVTGTVTDKADGMALPGVSVIVPGSKIGTQTGGDGKFTIKVPATAKTLQFSFLGYIAQTLPITSGPMTVVLASDSRQLSEVVVTGYGELNRKDVTAAVSSVSGQKLENKPLQSFEQALAGQAAGVNIIQPNGVLNNPPVFRIRGSNSISLSSYPLIVVDGIPVFTGDNSGNSAAGNALGDINPADIETIDILKDAAASAIYGSRAANGVVVITTKKGKQGNTKVVYDGWVGINQATNLPKLLDAAGYVAIKNEALANIGTAAQFFLQTRSDGSTVNTNWYDVAYHTGVSQNHGITFSGASPSTSYYVSVAYTDQESFINKNTFARKVGRVNLDHKLTGAIKVGANFSFSNSMNVAPNTGSLPGQAFSTVGLGRLAIVLPPNVDPYNEDGTYNVSGAAIGLGANKIASNYPNAAVLLNEDKNTSENNRLIGNFYAQATLVKGLLFKTSYGMDNLRVENIGFQNRLNGDGYTANGSATNTFNRNNRWNWVNTLNYSGSIGANNNISALAGYEEQQTTSDGWGANRTNVSDPFIETYQGSFGVIAPSGNSQGENSFRSFFANLNYDFGKRYFLSGSFRRDGYSGLAAGHKYGNFGGVSAGWAISEEGFFKNSSLGNTISLLKLRGSYGQVGNINIGNFPALSLYGVGLYGANPTITYSQAGNADLRWERSKKTDIGLNIAFLDGKIDADIDYFDNNIDQLAQDAPQSPSKGIPGNSIFTNVGTMYNRGFEISLSTTNVTKKNFSWSSTINFSAQKNRVTSLANNNADIFGVTSLETANITRVGYALGSVFVVPTAGVDPQTGERIFINKNGQKVRFSFQRPTATRWLFYDGTNAGTTAPLVDASDAVIVGQATPKWFGGFDNTMKFKDFDLNFTFTFSGGNKLYYGTQAGLRDQRFWNNEAGIMRRWTTVGQETDIPRLVYGDNTSNGSAFAQSQNVYDGDFLKMKSIDLGYRVPPRLVSKAGISSLRFYVQSTNLFVLTKYEGPDPEVSVNGNANLTPGVDRNSVPLGRSLTFGINVGF